MTPEKYTELFFKRFAPRKVGGKEMYNYLLKRFTSFTKVRYREDFGRGKVYGIKLGLRLGIRLGRKEILKELRGEKSKKARQSYLCGYNDCKKGRKL